MDLEDIMLSEGSQRRTNAIKFLLYEASEIVKGDNGMMVTGVGGGRHGELFFNGYKVTIIQEE